MRIIPEQVQGLGQSIETQNKAHKCALYSELNKIVVVIIEDACRHSSDFKVLFESYQCKLDGMEDSHL